KLLEAIASCRKAISLDPRVATYHNSLGVALRDQGDLDEAIAECRKAIELDPSFEAARGNLGWALRFKGKFAASLAAFQQWQKVVAGQPLSKDAAQEVARAEQFVQLESQMARFLSGEAKPASAKQCLLLSDLWYRQQLYVAVVRIYREALTQDPGLAGDYR